MALIRAHAKVLREMLVDKHEEQATIRAMAQWRSGTGVPPVSGQAGFRSARFGWTLEYIADCLNAIGVRTKLGCQWQAANVASVLKSRRTARLLGLSGQSASTDA